MKPTSTLAEKVARARVVRVQLAAVTDELTASLQQFEAALVALGLGVAAWVDLTDADEARRGYTRRLAFQRYGAAWRLVTVGMNPSLGKCDVVPLVQTSRKNRFEAAGRLADLVVAIVDQTVALSKTGEQKAAAIQRLTRALALVQGDTP